MGKVLEFPQERRKDAGLLRLRRASDKIDQVILEAVFSDGVAPHEMAGILAHRLGALIGTTDQKADLLGLCEKVLKKKAGAGPSAESGGSL
ncbi:MAG: hypothetical protein H6618_02495 [Deltaproteobacteria bacterium]|nr:hypothetical protein [Deltaproteobacteria bacterium]